MGCDIHSFAEVKRNNKWEKVEEKIFTENTEPFGWRSYGMFGFLANVRNYSYSTSLQNNRGLPLNSEYLNSPTYPENRSYYTETPVKIETIYDDIKNDYNYHNHGFIYLKEFLDFNYEEIFEDRRTTKQTGPNSWNGAALAEVGEGEITSYKDFLGESFFKELEILKSLGNPEDVRIVFWFDN